MFSFKKIVSRYFILFISLFITSFHLAAASDVREQFFLNGSYSLSFPTYWEREVDGDLSVSISPSEDDGSSLVIFAPDPDPELAGMSGQEFSDVFLSSIFDEGTESKILDQSETLLNGLPAHSTVYSFNVGGVDLVGGLYFLQSEGYTFVIMAVVPMIQVDAIMQTMSDAADSFTIYPSNLARIRDKLILASYPE